MPRKDKDHEKRGGNIFKKLLKPFTKPNGDESRRHHANGGDNSPRAVLPSSENQYAAAHSNSYGTAPSFTQRSPPKPSTASYSTTTSNNHYISTEEVSPPRPQVSDANILRWGLVLSRIPKLVNEATSVATNGSSPNGSAASSPTASGASNGEAQVATSVPEDMSSLLESLRQMASKEYQAQILQYYTGSNNQSSALSVAASNAGMTNINILSNWEQRRVFKQCRRALLHCWKFIIAQLNDEKVQNSITSEQRTTYYQLLGLIAERVEFNLLPDTPTTSSSSSNGRPPVSHARRPSHPSVNTFVSPLSPASSASLPQGDSSANSNDGNSEESGTEGEHNIYLYRCLLVATFRHVIENIEAAAANRRSFISYAEWQFYAKVLAICFYRIPVVQRIILDGVFEAYRSKVWTKTNPGTSTTGPPNAAQLNSRLNRRRSSSKPWNSMTFEGTLARWSEFEGQSLTEYEPEKQPSVDDPEGKLDYSDKLSESSSESSENISNNANANPFAPQSRSAMEKYKRANPTLFRWTRYSPYLGPYADSDVFRTHDAPQSSWLLKLTQDGEFFACFMSAYSQHADLISMGEPVWYCLPGYSLLIRISMLLVKEASWQKWLSVRDTTDNIISAQNGNQEDRPAAFEVKSSRSVKTVLDGVVQLLKNRDILESCVLALFECTNVLNSKSVSVCLSRLEEWFGAAAIRMGENANGDVSYRLPSNFHGQALGTGIRIMLCSESFEILSRTLQFLYNRMDYFDGELRQNVLKAIVQRHMFLFLHWNADVRNSYHHLLVYKIIRTNRYLLDSPIDQLLVGRNAMLPMDGSNGRDENTAAIGFDDTDGPYDDVDQRPVLSAAEYNILRLEQALWRAFDACLAAICVQERRHAREANRKYQVELQAARSRAIAFQNLNLKAVGDDDIGTNSVNEGLPGGKPSHELDFLNDELNREPPYYLRYLPAEEVSSLDELRRLAQTVKYPAELQVYAAISLRGYSDLLKKYFEDLREFGYAEAPPLGYV